jgi:hypothetical protein
MAREEFETTNAALLDAGTAGDQRAEIAAHTPTPWRIQFLGNAEADLIHKGTFAGITAGSGRPEQLDRGDLAEWEANAAFIVRAVNAHEELVAALQRMLLDLDKDGQAAAIATLNTLGRAALAKATSTGK